jgi:hypothetical protein
MIHGVYFLLPSWILDQDKAREWTGVADDADSIYKWMGHDAVRLSKWFSGSSGFVEVRWPRTGVGNITLLTGSASGVPVIGRRRPGTPHEIS